MSALPDAWPGRALTKRMMQAQSVPALIPSYDRLLWADDGALWVQTVGPELADVHPLVLAAHPDLGPPHREWDVFGPDGRLERVVVLPAGLEVRVASDGVAWGFVRDAAGAVAVAEVRW